MPDHHGVPYSLTEDFVTVYRMHPLIPDDYRFCRPPRPAKLLGDRDFHDIQGADADEELRRLRPGEHRSTRSASPIPGAITLHNYPRRCSKFERDGELIDLSVVDLVRTRRRGVPRYNDFRAGLHKPRITRWEDLCDDPESVRPAAATSTADIDEVDTMVGPVRRDTARGLRLLATPRSASSS